MSVHPIHNKTNIDLNSMHVVAFGYKSMNWSMTEPRSVEVSGTTLFSPTGESMPQAIRVITSNINASEVYLPFNKLYASDSCGVVGQFYTDKIVAITDLAILQHRRLC
jgi:hypothetical protein